MYLPGNEQPMPTATKENPNPTAYPNEVFCFKAREAALEKRRLGMRWVFVPDCTIDDTYSPIQCSVLPLDNENCWCVRADGKSIPKTMHSKRSRIYLKPNCKRHRSKSKKLLSFFSFVFGKNSNLKGFEGHSL